MVVCLMRVSSKFRRLLAPFVSVLFAALIFLETFLALLKIDKILEFSSLGIYEFLWEHDALFVCSWLIFCGLLLFSVFLLVFVFDVAISQGSEEFRVDMKNHASSIYLILVSLVFCVLSFAISLRITAEFDQKMTKLLMAAYLKYGESDESRVLVDRIHMEYSCCGVASIEDLLDLSEVDSTLPAQTKLWSCNEWEYCSVPLSCCKSNSCSQKVKLLNEGWITAEIVEKWFNRRGCIGEMDNSFVFFGISEHLVSDFVMILVLGFHVAGVVLMRILTTASATLRAAHLDFSEESYAWLLDIGQPDPEKLARELNPELSSSQSEVPDREGKETEKEQETEVDALGVPMSTGVIGASESENLTGTASNTAFTTGTTASADEPTRLSATDTTEVLVFDSDGMTGTRKIFKSGEGTEKSTGMSSVENTSSDGSKESKRPRGAQRKKQSLGGKNAKKPNSRGSKNKSKTNGKKAEAKKSTEKKAKGKKSAPKKSVTKTKTASKPKKK